MQPAAGRPRGSATWQSWGQAQNLISPQPGKSAGPLRVVLSLIVRPPWRWRLPKSIQERYFVSFDLQLPLDTINRIWQDSKKLLKI